MGRRRFCNDACAGAAQARLAAQALDVAVIEGAAQAQAMAARLDAELAERVGQAARLTHELAMVQTQLGVVTSDAATMANILHTVHERQGGQWYGPATRNLVAKCPLAVADGQRPARAATATPVGVR